MTTVQALGLLAALAALAALPSASVALVVTRAATAGLAHGITVTAGILLGDLIFVLAALLGLSALAEALGGLFTLIKLLGGLYLAWLGLVMLRAPAERVGWGAASAPSGGLTGNVLAGLLLTLADVKAVLFYASLFPLFVDVSRLTPADTALIMAITVLGVGGVKLTYALAAHRLAALVGNARIGHIARRAVGGVLLGIGGYVIATA
jgi:threonine/homoserine/homoserine lactone efflux protein